MTMHDKVSGNFVDSFIVQGGNIYNAAFNGKEYCISPNSNQAYCHTVVQPGTGCP